MNYTRKLEKVNRISNANTKELGWKESLLYLNKKHSCECVRKTFIFAA